VKIWVTIYRARTRQGKSLHLIKDTQIMQEQTNAVTMTRYLDHTLDIGF